MKRREAIRARKADEKPKKLLESDFLLGVYDEARMGGLRFKTEKDGDFLSNDKDYATPPWTSLRDLGAHFW
jgi:serine/threonine-protein kinase HipA